MNTKKLSELEQLTELPESATVLAEVDGEAKRAPTDLLGQVKTVNGVAPDNTGNVQIAIPDSFSGSYDDLTDLPFGVMPEKTYIVEKREITGINPYAYLGSSEVAAGLPVLTVPDGEVTLYVNGREYRVSPVDGFVINHDFGDQMDAKIYGDQAFQTTPVYVAYNTTFKQYHLYAPSGTKLPITFAWYKEGEEIVVPISEELMPESVPVLQTARAGQAVVVDAVDSNGAPTGWSTADLLTVEALPFDVYTEKELLIDPISVPNSSFKPSGYASLGRNEEFPLDTETEVILTVNGTDYRVVPTVEYTSEGRSYRIGSADFSVTPAFLQIAFGDMALVWDWTVWRDNTVLSGADVTISVSKEGDTTYTLKPDALPDSALTTEELSIEAHANKIYYAEPKEYADEAFSSTLQSVAITVDTSYEPNSEQEVSLEINGTVYKVTPVFTTDPAAGTTICTIGDTHKVETPGYISGSYVSSWSWRFYRASSLAGAPVSMSLYADGETYYTLSEDALPVGFDGLPDVVAELNECFEDVEGVVYRIPDTSLNDTTFGGQMGTVDTYGAFDLEAGSTAYVIVNGVPYEGTVKYGDVMYGDCVRTDAGIIYAKDGEWVYDPGTFAITEAPYTVALGVMGVVGKALKSSSLPDTVYSKDEIDAIMGAYINDIDALIGGEA